jgi:glycosyltransferase involved in cell wall biosynthesis
LKKVSVIVPCYNEQDYILSFIDDLRSQDYPADHLEFIIADGLSTDGTRDLLAAESSKDNRISVLTNEARTTPHALNLALEKATGEVIVRMDVHAKYPKNYITKLVSKLEADKSIGNVGAVLITSPANDSLVSRGIAKAMSSRIGVGNSKFRTGAAKDVFTDTVPFGCFPKKIFDLVGRFNEKLIRSQDYEFNTRIIKQGYKILLTPDVTVKYYSRNTYKKTCQMFCQYAYSKVLSNREMRTVGTLRQLAPPGFYFIVSGLLALGPIEDTLLTAGLSLLLAYMSFIAAYCVYSCGKRGSLRVSPYMAFAIICMHASYAYGYFKGILDFVILKKDSLQSLAINR